MTEVTTEKPPFNVIVSEVELKELTGLIESALYVEVNYDRDQLAMANQAIDIMRCILQDALAKLWSISEDTDE